MKMMMSISPVITRWAKSTAAGFSAIPTSRIEGLTDGTPPNRSMSEAISVARRLSKAATRRPPKPAPASPIRNLGSERKNSQAAILPFAAAVVPLDRLALSLDRTRTTPPGIDALRKAGGISRIFTDDDPQPPPP